MVLSLLLLGCLKQPAAVQAPEPQPVAVSALLVSVDDGLTAPASDEVLARLSGVIQARNLTPRVIDAAPLAGRPAQLRLDALSEAAPDAPLRLLVEASARFFSQMNGQYRWTVEVHLELVPAGQPERALTDRFEVPVFLQFDHEGEPEALLGALPVVERRLGALLDSHLRGGG